jgi:hypothetical protein
MYKRAVIPVLLALVLLSGLLLPAAVRATPAAAAVTGSSLLAAGDVGSCSDTTGSTATAALIGAHSGIVGMLGDANGTDNSLAQYQQCYGPTWGNPARGRGHPNVLERQSEPECGRDGSARRGQRRDRGCAG